jgi:hypothetical protein
VLDSGVEEVGCEARGGMCDGKVFHKAMLFQNQ